MIDKNLMFIKAKSQSREEVLNEFASAAYKNGYITTQEEFIDAVMEREMEMSTSIGNQIAIPHGRSKSVLKPFVGYMNTSTAFSWDDSEKLVNLVFLIGVPEKLEGTLHLKILSQISRNLIKESFREKLNNSVTIDDVYLLLREIEIGIEEETNESTDK